MGRVLKWVLGVLVGLVALVVVGVALFPWDRAAGWAAERASQVTGRQVGIQGLHVDWSWHPVVTLRGITVANAPWGSEPLMADIEQVRAVVSLSDLLRGRLALPELVVTRPKVLLEKSQEGTGNWRFEGAAADEAGQAAAPEDRGEFPLIGRIAIEEGLLTYKDQAKQANVTSRIATVAGDGGDDALQLTGEGNLAGKPLKVEVTAGPLLALRESEEPYPIDIKVRAGGTRAEIGGTFEDPVQLQGPNLGLMLEGPNLAEIFPLFGIPTPITDKYALEGHIRREGELWAVRDLKGRVGQSDLSGWVTLEPRDVRPLIKAELKSQKLRLQDLGGLIGMTADSAQKQNEPAGADGQLVPDTPVALDRLKAADMEVGFTGGDVQVPVLPLKDVAFHLSLKDGVARMDPLKMTAEVGRIAGSAVLDGSKETPVGRFDIGIQGVGLKPFFAGTRFEDETEGTIGGRVKLAGSGKSLSGILGAADGEIVMVMEGGKVSHLLVEAAGVDIAEALGDLIGGDEPVGVRCLVADLDVKDGLLKTKTLVFDTTDTNIAGNITSHLGKETLDGRIEAYPKDPSPLAARMPVTFGGTWANPKLGVEAENAAAKGAAAVALGVLLTPLAAIIPFLETGGGEDSPCRSLIQQAEDKPKQEQKPAKGRKG